MGERERFRKLSGSQHNVRFMECGSCKEVTRRVAVIRALAKEAERGIRIGGVIDRDFLAARDIQKVEQDEGVHVLAVHEVENFFLDPETLKQLQRQPEKAGAITDFIKQVAEFLADREIQSA